MNGKLQKDATAELKRVRLTKPIGNRSLALKKARGLCRAGYDARAVGTAITLVVAYHDLSQVPTLLLYGFQMAG